jgi:hypothetical protein
MHGKARAHAAAPHRPAHCCMHTGSIAQVPQLIRHAVAGAWTLDQPSTPHGLRRGGSLLRGTLPIHTSAAMKPATPEQQFVYEPHSLLMFIDDTGHERLKGQPTPRSPIGQHDCGARNAAPPEQSDLGAFLCGVGPARISEAALGRNCEIGIQAPHLRRVTELSTGGCCANLGFRL